MTGTTPLRYQSLDILRGVASLAVVIYHYKHFFFSPGEYGVDPADPGFDLSAMPFYDALRLSYVNGWSAVQLFFVLSGFIFFALYHRKVNEKSIGGWKFSVLRFSRLYPLHLLTLLMVLVLQVLSMWQNGAYLIYQFNDAKHFILNLFFASQWGFQSGESFNGPVWSVSIEILLYAVFFWASRNIRFNLIRCTLAAVLFASLWFVNYQISTALVCFFAGGGVFFLSERVHDTVPNPTTRVLTAYAVLAGTILIVMFIPSNHFLEKRSLNFLVYPAVVFLFATIDRSSTMNLRWIRWVGDITYSTYMLHVPLQMMILLAIGGLAVDVNFYHPGIFLGFGALLIIVSIFSYRYFELPLQSAIRSRLVDSARGPG